VIANRKKRITRKLITGTEQMNNHSRCSWIVAEQAGIGQVHVPNELRTIKGG